MKQNGFVIFAVWAVILTGIGVATYYGAKAYRNNEAYKQLEKEKQVLSDDDNKEDNKSTKNKIIDSLLNKNKTKTTKSSTSNSTKNSTSNKSSNTTSTDKSNKNTTNSKNKETSTSNSSNTKTTTKSGSKTTNNNSSTNTTTTPSSNTDPIKQLVRIDIREESEVVMEKYGTKQVSINRYQVEVYDDGSEIKTLLKTSTTYDKSGYNGTASMIRPEASQVLTANYNDYVALNNLINNYRQQAGAAPLTLDNDLCLAATVRAIERAYAFEPDYTGHARPNGSQFYTLLDELSINKGKATGENVTAALETGTKIAADVYPYQTAALDWYNSSGHRANLEKPNYNKTGIGAYQLGNTKYWVQIFVQTN